MLLHSLNPEPLSDLAQWFASEWTDQLSKLLDGDVPDSEMAILELAALNEALNTITRREPVYIMTRPRTPEDTDTATPILVGRESRPAESWRSRSEQAATVLADAWNRVSQTRWRHIARMVRGDTISFPDMRLAMVAHPDTALVEFHVTESGTLVYLSRGGPAAETEHTPAASLANDAPFRVLTYPDLTLSYLRNLMQPITATEHASAEMQGPEGQAHCGLVTDDVLGQIYGELLAPIVQQLIDWSVRQIVFVPHRALHLVPLHACWHMTEGQRRYLLDDYVISYAPSSTLANICRERTTNVDTETLTIISNPGGDLRFAEYESQQIAKYFEATKTQILQGGEAKRERILSLTPGAVIHFAGHATYCYEDPLQSSLHLANKQSIMLADMFDEKLPLPETGLVVLSACETNVTDPDDLADEYLGLTSGFLFAGTSMVISSLWSVNDFSTALLMDEFYRRHREEGQDILHALRGAQLWLRDLRLNDVLSKVDAAKAACKAARDDQLWFNLEAWREMLIEDNASDANAQPFSEPHYWAAFTVTGGY